MLKSTVIAILIASIVGLMAATASIGRAEKPDIQESSMLLWGRITKNYHHYDLETRSHRLVEVSQFEAR